MLLNKSKFRISLKQRLALSFALLFFISGLIIFFLTEYFLHRRLDDDGDTYVKNIASQITSIYAAGGLFKDFDEILPPETIPEDDRMLIYDKYPGVDILFAFHNSANVAGGGDEYYTACTVFKKKYYAVRVKDGEVVFSRMINLQQNKFRMRNYISRIVRAYGQSNTTIAFIEENNKISDFYGRKMPDFRAIWRDKKFFESGEFRYLTFAMPHGATLVIGRTVRERNELIKEWQVLFFTIMVIIIIAGICSAWLLTRRFFFGIRQTVSAMDHIAEGDYSYRISTVYNDREIVELIDNFNRMNERTEKLLQEIKMISDNVAHDLRTPLTRISGTVELLLRDRALAEPLRSVCVSVAEECGRLTTMVNTMMDISRTNSRPNELERSDFDPAEELEDLCEFMQPAFEDKGIAFKLELPDEAVMINADRSRFQRVMVNLMENALKFTAAGSVTVSIINNEKSVDISVKDTGCGIPESDQTHIFERFFRSDASRHLQGNGLGLALVQAIANAHQWKIKLDSTVEKGTEFIITIDKI